MSSLKWLDGFGNGQVNERTKKIPRDMFKNEYLKLQHVYERKNRDVVVASPDKNVVEFKGNFFEIPQEKIINEDRVRIEKHGGMILIYHALTNDLLCKYVVPDGEGNIMTLPKKNIFLQSKRNCLLIIKSIR